MAGAEVAASASGQKASRRIRSGGLLVPRHRNYFLGLADK